MKIKRLRRLFNGLASIRDHDRERFINNGGVVLVVNDSGHDRKMTLSPHDLQERMFQISKRKFISKKGTAPYEMWDIKFKEDENEIQIELFKD